MSVDIDSIKRKLLIKYPTFGSTIANLEFQEMEEVGTAATDGKSILYNPKFVNKLSDKEKVFIFAHEVSHVAFDHIFRSEGKDPKLWNIAADAVTNAWLKEDGLEMVEGGVYIPEAIKYDVEEMYNKLLEEKQNEQQRQGNQNSQDNQEKQDSQENEDKQEDENNVGHDDHSLWEKAIEERKQQQQNQQESKENQEDEDQIMDNNQEIEKQQTNELVEKGEKESFRENKEERRRQLQELSKELSQQAAQGTGSITEGRKLTDIGIAVPLIDWRKLLNQAIKYEEQWSRKNARMRDGYFRHKVEQIPIPETEIVLDTSGSVSETLLRNFLRECKNILENSRVKVGCFDTKFHGFTELRRMEDIDNMSFPTGGGTDFNAAVEAFSQRVPNKIIFTDGEAPMPKKEARNAIWVVFGDREIKPKGGKVISIRGEQLERLYRENNKDRGLSR